jgi:Dyp-type peroxidase family
LNHALVTIIAPIDAPALAALPAQISAMGNPATQSIRERLDVLEGEPGTHFMSLHAIPAGAGSGGHLVLEFSADGGEDSALARIASALTAELENIFSRAADWRQGGTLLTYLRAHRVQVGHGLFSHPGIAYSGTAGMSVGRIRKERDLAAHVTALLGAQPGGLRASERLTAVRDALRGTAFAWALEPSEAPAPAQPPLSIVGLAVQSTLAFVCIYLWPLVLLLLAGAAYAGYCAYVGGQPPSLWTGVVAAACFLFKAALPAIAAVAAAQVAMFCLLRRAEARDWVDERAPDRATLAEILKRENHSAQNHMVSVTRRKPGFVRWFVIRVVFWLSSVAIARVYRPGFLNGIGTIHFARWVTVPGTRDFLFFSNYGGSWESYLEDFITLAHYGLTAIWSNSVGFPRSSNLIQGGASDGERFKRYARRSMLPTPFWYSAYPTCTTAHIRTNTLVRRGLAAALSNDEAQSWLALFGSSQRPDTKLESNDIQSIVFGGLGFMRFGTCLLFQLSEDRGAAQDWLRQLLPDIAFNDGHRLQRDAVIIAAVGPHALIKLNLPEACVMQFPAAYLDGMAAPDRARILGDVGDNAAGQWRWGRETPDVALLVYGTSPEAVAQLRDRITKEAVQHGHARLYQIDLKEIPENKKTEEPFGFVDGVSQPVIRGTYRALRRHDPIHVVEAGEFVLGYPDNRGNHPPGPRLSPLLDPNNRLPITAASDDFATNIVDQPRDIGRNGTFLVIRQLEQNVAAFDEYCKQEAARLKDRLPPPYQVTAGFIAAKLVGRWKDGSSLARYPYRSRTADAQAKVPSKAMSRPQSASGESGAIDPPDKPGAGLDNDFLLGAEDPEALRCPFGAHIRRANPRDSFDPASPEQLAISNRHRMLRVGRPYQPQDGHHPGLLFMCLNGDIERQFEFIQQTWLASPSFHGLSGEQDPIVGDGAGATGFTIPSRDGPLRLKPLPRFVTTLGGGYFFVPSKRLLSFLAGDV